jgi:cardiolipin synthase A/B
MPDTKTLLILFHAIYLIVAFSSAIHALLNKRDSRSALGWIGCCLLIPYAGPLLYLIFGINRTRQSARKLRPEPDDSGIEIKLPPAATVPRFPMAVVGSNVTRKPLLPCSQLKVLINGDAAYPEMLTAIDKANSTVYLSTYIFANDDTGLEFIEALGRARQRGVDVRVIVDGLGEYMSIPRVGGKLKREKLHFKRFNPVTFLPFPLQLNMRNHRKLLVVDGTTAFTGGMNIWNHHYVSQPRGNSPVQDVHFRLHGSIVTDMEYAFLKDWDYCAGTQDAVNFKPQHAVTLPCDKTPIWSRLILDGPNEHLDKFSDTLIGIISAGRHRVWLMTPYFLPEADIIGALQAARLRNLDVKVVLPAENNIHLSHWATHNLLWQLLNHGVEVYYQKPPFSHSKLLIVDDDYSLIGSANIDPRSIRLNFELGIEIFSKTVNQQLHSYFEEKLDDSTMMTLPILNARPFLVKIRDAGAWLFSPYL